MTAATYDYDPYEHARQVGATVIWADPGAGRLGLTIGTLIVLRPGRPSREERCTLAHEIVHVEHEDWPVQDHAWHARREARCDRIAAARLIDPVRFQEVTTWTDDPGAWAVELRVTRRILEAYIKEHYGSHLRQVA